MRVIADIIDPDIIQKILDHIEPQPHRLSLRLPFGYIRAVLCLLAQIGSSFARGHPVIRRRVYYSCPMQESYTILPLAGPFGKQILDIDTVVLMTTIFVGC
jgi:hypothetical protein